MQVKEEKPFMIPHWFIGSMTLSRWPDSSNKPATDQTWTNFQEFFAKHNEEYYKNFNTSGLTGYSTNAIKELIQTELANIVEQFIQEDGLQDNMTFTRKWKISSKTSFRSIQWVQLPAE